MIIFCIGDPHFKEDVILELDEMCNEIYLKIELRKPDIIVVMGDVLDRFDNASVYAHSLCIKFLLKLSTYATTYCLIGNHDRPNNSDFMGSYHFFYGISNDRLIIIDKARIIQYGDYKFMFIPYVATGRFKEALYTVMYEDCYDILSIDYDDFERKIKEYKLIFAHQEFKGCSLRAQRKSVNGDIWSDDYCPIISGHIHEHHMLGHNILYVGTPRRVTMSESDYKVTCTVYINSSPNCVEDKEDYNFNGMLIYNDKLKIYPKEICYTDIHGISDFLKNNKWDVKYKKYMVKCSEDEMKMIQSTYSSQLRKVKKQYNIKIEFDAYKTLFMENINKNIHKSYKELLYNAIENDEDKEQLLFLYEKIN